MKPETKTNDPIAEIEPLEEVKKDFALRSSSKRSLFDKIHHLLGDHKGTRYFFIAVFLTVLVGIGLLAWMISQPSTTFPSPYKQYRAPKAVKFYSPLTGTEGPEEATKRPVTAVMIENSPDARPQSGLKDAGVIYEAVAEGGITRFIALYQESRPGLIGPVRSVRPYYVEWASAYDPAVAHIGGSARALEMIRSGNYGVDLDQFFNAGAYWRASDRYAPHNVYTNFDKLDALRSSKGKNSSSFTGFKRQDEKKVAEPNATHLDIDVSSGSFHVTYDYDAASNSYIRKQGGQNHTDREGGQIQPKVVIALKVDMHTGFEDGNREQISTTGSGGLYVFQNGTVQEGTWSRSDAKSPLVLTGSDSKEITLNRGQTWITAVSNGRGVSWQ